MILQNRQLQTELPEATHRSRWSSQSSLQSRNRKAAWVPTIISFPKYKEVWNWLAATKFGQLAQGIDGRVKGMDTVRFIQKHEVPADRFKDVTYIKFVCQVRTEKKDPYQTRATMGGTISSIIPMTWEHHIFVLDSLISMPGGQFTNADISNFLLMTPHKCPEYAKLNCLIFLRR